jgi:tetratricopeptide (TPR) repeat protein
LKSGATDFSSIRSDISRRLAYLKNVASPRKHNSAPWWDSPAVKAAVIFLLTFAAYIPAMRGGFIWDDDKLLFNSPLIKAGDGLRRIWFSTEAYDYFPLSYSALWLQWRLWGLHTSGYHLVNIFLHALGTVLLWRVLLRLKIPGAWLVALVFALHPVCVASVAWISELKNTLSQVFYMPAILFFLRFDEERRGRWLGLALGAFLIALLAKSSVVMLPVLLLLCIWWRRGKITPHDVLQTLPFFALSLVFGLLTIWFQLHRAMQGAVPEGPGFAQRLVTAACAVWFYIFKTIAPLNLSMIYPKWDVDPGALSYSLPALLLVALAVVLWCFRKTWARPFCFALGCFVATLFPVLGFVQMIFAKQTAVADHWQYAAMPCILALIIGPAVVFFTRDPRRVKFSASLAAVVLAALFALTCQRAGVFKNLESVARDTIRQNPGSWVAHNNLADALDAQGKTDEAIAEYYAAMRANPGFIEAYNNLGVALANRNRLDEAIPYFYEAVRLKPDYPENRKNLALVLARLGRVDEAAAHCEEILRQQPGMTAARYLLGRLYFNAGNLREAAVHFSAVVDSDPGNLDALNDLATIRASAPDASLRNGTEAAELAARCCKLTGYKNAQALVTLGAAFAEQGHFDDAIKTAQDALELARAASRTELAAQIERQILFYKRGRPLRLEPAAAK